MTKCPFNFKEDKLLIHYVRQYPALYDPKNADYKNQDIRDDLWDTIAENIDKKVSDCKKRWRSIRDTFFRAQRQYNRQVDTGRRLKRPKWSLLEHLTFLNNFGSEKRFGNTSPNDSNLSASFTRHIIKHSAVKRLPPELRSDESASSTLRNRPQEHLELHTEPAVKRKKSNDEYDSVLTFFRSMALMVKDLEPEMIAEAKSKVFAVVMQLEQRALQNKEKGCFVKLESDYTSTIEDECITKEEAQIIIPDIQQQ
ncbi:Myb/SANT-like transcription factor [Oryctes borbonicus]|uniref:Myb/SANT-like transcription factor n=1 Tax=Oryctes borbonicus TaxID=1629725 RepID=A0A0T6B1Z9_9SCAR|nr:Myb/SANT-like transcription factor [Oryctes borbonicus]